jgi:hypothetical protein
MSSTQLIKCNCGASFFARTIDIKKGLGKYCSRRCNSAAQAETGRLRFLKHCKESHYDSSRVHYINSKTEVELGCSRHGWFRQKPERLLGGHGCQKCGYETTSDKLKGIRISADEFIIRAIEKHGMKYDYSNSVYTGCSSPVEIVCANHGSFLQNAASHLSGSGCPRCVAWGEHLRSNLEEFIQRARVIHDNFYDYNLVYYENAVSVVNIICPKHGIFQQRPHSHLSGSGCPKCSVQVSKPEMAWLDSLHIKGLIRQYLLPNLAQKVDGFDPVTMTVYQFHGDFYHGNPNVFHRCKWNPRCKKLFGELYDRTVRRDQEVILAGFNLVVMWESDWIRSQHEV